MKETKISLNDNKVKQNIGDNLELQGHTNIAGELYLKGIRLVTDGITEGQALVYDASTGFLKPGDVESEFNGARTVTRPGLPAINPGGSTIGEFLNNYFFPAVPSTLSLTLNKYMLTKGEMVDLEINGSLSLNDGVAGPGNYLSLYDITGTQTLLVNAASNSLNYSKAEINTSTAFKLEVMLTNMDKVATTAAINFVSPMFYGVSDADILNQAQIEARLTKITATQGDAVARQQLNFTAAGQRMFFAYPKAYGSLTGIIDPDNSNVLAGFIAQRYEVTFNWPGFEPEGYYVYFNDSDFTATNFKLSFNY